VVDQRFDDVIDNQGNLLFKGTPMEIVEWFQNKTSWFGYRATINGIPFLPMEYFHRLNQENEGLKTASTRHRKAMVALLVMEAMREQFNATCNYTDEGLGEVAENITNRIIKLFE
jgi:hypothetical protein